MVLVGRNCLVVIDGVLCGGVVMNEYQYNAVMDIAEYPSPQVVDKGNIIHTLHPSADKKLKQIAKDYMN